MVDIDWLANLIGELVCFDETPMGRDRLGYAKALIEVKPDRFLSSLSPVEPASGLIALVDVGY